MGDQQNGAALPALPFSKLKDGALLQFVATLGSNHALDRNIAPSPLSDSMKYPRPRYTRARNYLRGIVLRKLRLGVKSQFSIVAPTFSHKLFKSLPFELCFEVFSHLHPLDLYHLAQVSKALRRLVLSPAAVDVWNRSFVEHSDDLPNCPPGVSGPKWATFLFGPPICERCGSSWANLHFGISMKLCENCSVWVLIDEDYAWELCEAHEHFVDSREVLQLCQRSLGSGVYFMRHQRELVYVIFTEEDVLEAIRLACFTCNNADNKTFSREQWLSMKNRRLSLVESRNKHIMECQSWLDGIIQDNKAFEMRWYAERIKKHFLKMGHDQADIDSVHPETDMVETLNLRYMQGLSRHDLRVYLKWLDIRMPYIRQFRLYEERMSLIGTVYQSYKRDLPHSEWKHLPGELDWDRQATFRPFFDDLENLNRPDDGFTPARIQAILPAALDDWHEKGLTFLRVQMLRVFGGEESQLPDGVLDLAVSVFSCGYCSAISVVAGRRGESPAYSGLDAILTHICSKIHCTGHSVTSCHRGHEAVLSILRPLKLDPQTTTAKELDNLNARFFCAVHQGQPEDHSCSHKGKRKALTWRECINHATDARQPNVLPIGFKPQWHLLTEYATQIVRSREPQWPKLEDAVWGCTLCGEHSSTAVTWSAAEIHVAERHGISTPKRDRDIVHLANHPATSREPLVYPFGQNASICLLCLRGNSSSVVAFNVYKQLQRHLRISHGVTKPAKGRSWDLVKAYEDNLTEAGTELPTFENSLNSQTMA